MNHRGDTEKLAGQIDTVLDRVTFENFDDIFKCVFERQAVPEQDITAVIEFLREQRDRIGSES